MTKKQACEHAARMRDEEVARLYSLQKEAMVRARVAQDRATTYLGTDAYSSLCRASAMMWERYADIGNDINFVVRGT